MTDYAITLENTVFQALSGTSTPSGGFPSGGSWSWSKNGRMLFDVNPASADAIYVQSGIVGWRIDIHVSSLAGSTSAGAHKLYWNFDLANPGVTATTPTTGSTGYGPADGSPGSYFDITGPGAYSITVGAPYNNTFADEPYEVLDRMRNGSGFDHGSGFFQGAFANDAGACVIDALSVVFFTAPEIDTPCDTWVDLDLSTAVFLGTEAVPDGFGQYNSDDGTISTIEGQYPDFYFPGLTLDATKAYKVEVTYDPDSSHSGGSGREVAVRTVRPGHEAEDYRPFHDSGTGAWLYDTGFPTTGDVQTFTVGPGRPRGVGIDSAPGWDDATYGVAAGYTVPWFETDVDGAVPAIRIRKICTFGIPFNRLTNRNFGLTRAGYYRQGGNRLTGPI